MKLISLLVAFIPLALFAQTGGSNSFPPTSTVATAQELSTYLSGKSFKAKYANGTTAKSKFGTDGSLSATAPNYYGTGRWRAEDGKLCGTLQKIGDFCNEARFDSGLLYLKRMNGEIIHYEPE